MFEKGMASYQILELMCMAVIDYRIFIGFLNLCIGTRSCIFLVYYLKFPFQQDSS